MPRRIIHVGHANDERDDRASAWAAGRGFETDWRFPCDGDGLPEIEAEALPGYEAKIKVVQALAHGTRLDVRLPDRFAEQPELVPAARRLAPGEADAA